MTVSDFIDMLKDYDGDMPILTPSLGTPTVRSVLGKVVIRENQGEHLALETARDSEVAY